MPPQFMNALVDVTVSHNMRLAENKWIRAVTGRLTMSHPLGIVIDNTIWIPSTAIIDVRIVEPGPLKPKQEMTT